jgi:tRNA threonylcarbamoyladenosine biosynthesis protein TsaE
VVALTGELGAGKTTLVQGAARALDVAEPVASPTFVLVRQYAGRLPVAHLDVYRLNRMQEVLDLGFEELLDGGWVVFVEWGDVIDALFPDAYLEVALYSGDLAEGRTASDDGFRRITVTGHGRAWAERWDRLAGAVDEWRAA